MKWISYQTSHGVRSGVLDGDQVREYPGPETLLQLISQDRKGLAAAGLRAQESAPKDVTTLSIVAPFRPPSMRDCIGFHEHLGAPAKELEPGHHMFPTFYFSNTAGVVGPYDDVRVSPGSEQFDYELEVGAVIGRLGHNIRPEDAEAHIIGYTIYIDWSARDLQLNEMKLQLGPAKGKDTATTLGPVLVTIDELEPYRKGNGYDLAMRASVNGQVITDNNWSTVTWGFADMIAYCSRGTSLEPGDVIGSGTVGRGCLIEHFSRNTGLFPGWLKPGDVFEASVAGIGSIRQTIAEPEERHPLSSGW